MTRQLTLDEVQKHLPGLIEELAESGDSVDIENDGRVVATLKATAELRDPPRTGEFLVGLLRGLPDDVVEDFLADVASARGINLPAPVDLD